VRAHRHAAGAQRAPTRCTKRGRYYTNEIIIASIFTWLSEDPRDTALAVSCGRSVAVRRLPYAVTDHRAKCGECRAVIANYVWIKGAYRTEVAETHTQLVISSSREAGRPV
jgi:hypothetical protein